MIPDDLCRRRIAGGQRRQMARKPEFLSGITAPQRPSFVAEDARHLPTRGADARETAQKNQIIVTD
jgi:hypothetical protein